MKIFSTFPNINNFLHILNYAIEKNWYCVQKNTVELLFKDEIQYEIILLSFAAHHCISDYTFMIIASNQ